MAHLNSTMDRMMNGTFPWGEARPYLVKAWIEHTLYCIKDEVPCGDGYINEDVLLMLFKQFEELNDLSLEQKVAYYYLFIRGQDVE